MLCRVNIPVAVAAAGVLAACSVHGAAGQLDQLRIGRGAATAPMLCVPAPPPVDLYKEDAETGVRQYVSLSNIANPEMSIPALTTQQCSYMD